MALFIICNRAELKAEGQCSPDLEHQQIKYLNNIIESDHGKLKRLINPTLGFKSMRTAYAALLQIINKAIKLLPSVPHIVFLYEYPYNI